MKRFIFIFLDGVGIGGSTKQNPFYVAQTAFLPFYAVDGAAVHALPDGTPVKAIDPLLGVEGIPQSATGQTALYTGENVPGLLGSHKGSYPNRIMRKIIKEKNILINLKRRGLNPVFINAYPVYGDFFTPAHMGIGAEGEYHFSEEFPVSFQRRISVTTCMMVMAQQAPFNETHIRAERSIFQEYTNRWLVRRGLELPEFTPEKAAEILYQQAQHYDFLLYEYFQTDLYGHRRDFHEQVQLVNGLNRLMEHLLSLMDPHNDTLLLTSDHGNLEDSTTRVHTRNPVPLVVWGQGSEKLRQGIDRLTDVTPGILKFFTY